MTVSVHTLFLQPSTATATAIARSRSVFERALDINHRHPSIWLKYAETELKARQVNHARNIYDRAITILPRVNQFWCASAQARGSGMYHCNPCCLCFTG